MGVIGVIGSGGEDVSLHLFIFLSVCIFPPVTQNLLAEKKTKKKDKKKRSPSFSFSLPVYQRTFDFSATTVPMLTPPNSYHTFGPSLLKLLTSSLPPP
jgi:hypothetical protein